MSGVKAFLGFPAGFLWGTATASHQVEGQNVNSDWWAWEQQGKIEGGDSAAVACDWWGGKRFYEDFDRAAEGGQNAHRLSVEWARIEPTPDVWDEDAVAYYREVLTALHERGITPMVTICHYCHPQWFLERGGWEQDDSPAIFERYARKVVRELGDLCKLWVTINEPNGYVYNAYLGASFPPGVSDFNRAMKVAVNLYRAHVAAYHAIHAVQAEAQVGWALYLRVFDPANENSPLDRQAATLLRGFFNDPWPKATVDGKFRTPLKTVAVSHGAKTADFLGLNYYTRDRVTFDITRPGELFGKRTYDPADEQSYTGFIAGYAEGLLRTVKWAHGFGLNLPIYISENGTEDPEDSLRRRFLVRHIRRLWDSVNYNYPVKGYFHWSLVDNFEWERGWSQRFGLYALDVETQVRTARSSAHLYAAICKANGMSSAMVAQYVPEVLDELFPGGA